MLYDAEQTKIRYLAAFKEHLIARNAAPADITHHAYDFPLTLTPAGYYAHPDVTGTPGMVIDHMGDLTGKKILDVGCGSAVLSLAAAYRNAGSVTACDIDENALALSIRNIAQNNQTGTITVGKSDVLSGIETHEKFDAVFANLWHPLVWKGYEAANERALGAYDRFFGKVRDILKPCGTVYLTSSSIADVQATRAMMDRHNINPVLKSRVSSHFQGTVDVRWDIYTFGQMGQPKPPMHRPF